jgi:carbamoyl-phosphate synthase large subunit/carbamoyl-phosphate synthase small subunit
MNQNTITLKLKDGTSISCKSFGYEKSVSGELVFNTGMVGYPESLTDPSYYGQILVITFPIIGIYGVPNKDKDDNGFLKYFESEKIHVKALIVADYSDNYEHYNAIKSLSEWLKEEKIPGLYDIDTRELTKKIRISGSPLCKIEFPNKSIDYWNPNKENIVEKVSIKEKKIIGNGSIKILVVDCGCKKSILTNLLKYDVQLIIVPWNYDFTEEEVDGILLSNGPGNPSTLDNLIINVRKMMDKNIPIFGICLGHQILALATNALTYKMKFGNRSMNQPVIDLRNMRCYITSQNHGFAVDETSLNNEWRPLFINGNDHSNEGIIHKFKPFFSVQFHPEGNGGPEDTNFLFDTFISLINTKKFPVNTINFKTKVEIYKVLVIGSGGISIGQAGEFDYSGSQCIKALKEENIEIILINPNIATVQTSDYMANKTYFLPINVNTVSKIIEKDRPDGILLQFGGQTALNCGISLAKIGILEKYNVKVLGTSIETIEKTEDRVLFNETLEEINEPIIPTTIIHDEDSAINWANNIGYPILVRTNYSLGGLGSGFVNNDKELLTMFKLSSSKSPEVTLSKSLQGWKEVEYEVVRDNNDNCIVVCNMENIDPVGVHTGDSIVIAPSLTLNNSEYFKLRESSIRIARHLNIIGECNVQYAIDTKSDKYYVIEVNARLSRSSALASKVTGYPLAYIATKISLGKDLIDLKNMITKSTIACFEPSLDYCVVKFPRWDNKKFTNSSNTIGSCMKSIGEIMAIGRTFEECFMKGLRMMNDNFISFSTSTPKLKRMTNDELVKELKKQTDNRIFVIFEAFNRDMCVDDVNNYTLINKWFLNKFKLLVNTEKWLQKQNDVLTNRDIILKVKKCGFSDIQISSLLNFNESLIRNIRKQQNIIPCVKQIDTLAAEFPAKTNYLYCTYNGTESDLDFNDNGVIVLGCGSYRIGSSCEFDWCAVSCLKTLKKIHKKSVMINYNPETVSTDYDETDRLYFEELSLERVLDIYEIENSSGVIVSVGGQIPNKLVMPLSVNGVKILGTQPESIDNAEDRYKFSRTLDTLKIDQPEWKELIDIKDIEVFANKIEFPVIVRPSYVLSGSAMVVAYSMSDLNNYLKNLSEINSKYPIVVSKFIEGAKEIEFDAVGCSGNIINYAISEHVENAGVHSGDATLILPAQKLYIETIKKIRKVSKQICKFLNITGPFNIQFLSKDNAIKVIECNLRASRSFPFVSKTLNVDFIELATRSMMGYDVKRVPIDIYDIDYIAIKCPMFSFTRLDGVDPVLKVEMSSTGEVACFGSNKYETYLNSIVSSGINIPKIKSALISIGSIQFKAEFLESVKNLISLEYTLYSTKGTCDFLKGENIESILLNKIQDNDKDNVINYLKSKKIGLVVNIPKKRSYISQTNGYLIRRCAIDNNIPLFTDIKNATLFISSLLNNYKNKNSMEIKSWQEYVSKCSY